MTLPSEPRKRPGPGFVPVRLPRTATDPGFSLHADVAVHQNDRQGLERLCRDVRAARVSVVSDCFSASEAGATYLQL